MSKEKTLSCIQRCPVCNVRVAQHALGPGTNRNYIKMSIVYINVSISS